MVGLRAGLSHSLGEIPALHSLAVWSQARGFTPLNFKLLIHKVGIIINCTAFWSFQRLGTGTRPFPPSPGAMQAKVQQDTPGLTQGVLYHPSSSWSRPGWLSSLSPIAPNDPVVLCSNCPIPPLLPSRLELSGQPLRQFLALR